MLIIQNQDAAHAGGGRQGFEQQRTNEVKMQNLEMLF